MILLIAPFHSIISFWLTSPLRDVLYPKSNGLTNTRSQSYESIYLLLNRVCGHRAPSSIYCQSAIFSLIREWQMPGSFQYNNSQKGREGIRMIDQTTEGGQWGKRMRWIKLSIRCGPLKIRFFSKNRLWFERTKLSVTKCIREQRIALAKTADFVKILNNWL